MSIKSSTIIYLKFYIRKSDSKIAWFTRPLLKHLLYTTHSLFCFATDIMILGTVDRMETYEVSLEADFFVNVWGTIRSRIGPTDSQIFDFPSDYGLKITRKDKNDLNFRSISKTRRAWAKYLSRHGNATRTNKLRVGNITNYFSVYLFTNENQSLYIFTNQNQSFSNIPQNNAKTL